jgi:hypothetical protein
MQVALTHPGLLGNQTHAGAADFVFSNDFKRCIQNDLAWINL